MKSIRTLLVDGPNHRLGLIGLAFLCFSRLVQVLWVTLVPFSLRPPAGFEAALLIWAISLFIGAILVSIYLFQWCRRIYLAVVSANRKFKAEA